MCVCVGGADSSALNDNDIATGLRHRQKKEVNGRRERQDALAGGVKMIVGVADRVEVEAVSYAFTHAGVFFWVCFPLHFSNYEVLSALKVSDQRESTALCDRQHRSF